MSRLAAVAEESRIRSYAGVSGRAALEKRKAGGPDFRP